MTHGVDDMELYGGVASAEWRVGSLAKGDDKDDAWGEIEGGGRGNFLRGFALGETGKMVVAGRGCRCQGDGRCCNYAAGLGNVQ